jgi:hypothetical protein
MRQPVYFGYKEYQPPPYSYPFTVHFQTQEGDIRTLA